MAVARFNTILSIFDRRYLGLISPLGYFQGRRPLLAKSAPRPCRTRSTPIDFENS